MVDFHLEVDFHREEEAEVDFHLEEVEGDSHRVEVAEDEGDIESLLAALHIEWFHRFLVTVNSVTVN